MSWIKKGRIFKLEDHDILWAKSHACVPTAHLIERDKIRVYHAPRNEKGQSIPTYFEVSAHDPSEILYVHNKPVMSLGELGTFDDGGIMPCCTVQVGDLIYMYYVGWNPSVSVSYRNSIGLATSNDGGVTFERKFKGPLVDRNRDEPFFTASPYVMREYKNLWHMWYASSTGFLEVDGKVEPLYVIKYASSTDGIDWKRDNTTCIEPSHPEEANARATVIKDNGIYKMWFCYRDSRNYRNGPGAYRIGYAESKDAVSWNRMDEKAGIRCSETGWDSNMQTYPDVLELANKKYLFYNGNGFGLTGIGYAEWIEN